MKRKTSWGAKLALSPIVASVITGTWAAPGTHGPNGEHLDAPVAAQGPTQNGPRVESNSDLFELVATFQDGRLTIFLDRFATNEPVLDATVEIESGATKAKAVFREAEGTYSAEDAGLLQLLNQPGSHPLVFTVVAGKESDLLEGALHTQAAVASQGGDHDHEDQTQPLRAPALAALAATLVGLAFLGWTLLRRRRGTSGSEVHK